MLQRQNKAIHTCACFLLLGLNSCAIRIDYGDDDYFRSCKNECEQALPVFDFPECYPAIPGTKRIDAWINPIDHVHEAIEATEFPDGACGCLSATVAESGQIRDLQVKYTNSQQAVQIVDELVGTLKFSENVDECFVGTTFPIVFPVITNTPDRAINGAHTVYPTRTFVADNELTQLSEIQFSDASGWIPLNTAYGILLTDQGRYLTEFRYCPAHIRTDSDIHVKTESMVLRAGRDTVANCKVMAIYFIETNEQLQALTNIADAPYPNPR